MFVLLSEKNVYNNLTTETGYEKWRIDGERLTWKKLKRLQREGRWLRLQGKNRNEVTNGDDQMHDYVEHGQEMLFMVLPLLRICDSLTFATHACRSCDQMRTVVLTWTRHAVKTKVHATLLITQDTRKWQNKIAWGHEGK